jgi:hypothetical protein
MSKKFRFYTLEELASKYNQKLVIYTAHIGLQGEDSRVGLHLLGHEFEYQGHPSWMGEEVVEKPETKEWSCDIDSDNRVEIIQATFNYTESFCQIMTYDHLDVKKTTRSHFKLPKLKEIIQHPTDIKEYLETKEK